MRKGSAGRITGYRLYRATYCARTDPLPLLPSGPGGVGGVASRRTRHILMIALRTGREKSQKSFLIAVRYQVFEAQIEAGFKPTLLQELDQHIGLDIDWLPSLQGMEIGTCIGVRNDGHGDHVALRRSPFPAGNGEADSLNRNRTLFY